MTDGRPTTDNRRRCGLRSVVGGLCCLIATAALAAEPPKEESMEVLQLRQQLYQTQIQNLQLQGQILQFNFQALSETKSRVDEEIKRRQAAEEKKPKEGKK